MDVKQLMRSYRDSSFRRGPLIRLVFMRMPTKNFALIKQASCSVRRQWPRLNGYVYFILLYSINIRRQRYYRNRASELDLPAFECMP